MKYLLLLLISNLAWAGLPPASVQGPSDTNPVTTFKTIYTGSGVTVSHSGVAATVNISGSAAGSAVGAIYYASANRSPGSGNQINFDSLITDTNSAVTTGASWAFTVPASQGGSYIVTASLNLTGSTAGNFFIYKNGSKFLELSTLQTTSGVASSPAFLQLSAGDVIDIRPDSSVTISGGSSPIVSQIGIFKQTATSAASSSITFVTETSNYNVQTSDVGIICGTATSAPFTLTMPAASSTSGRVYYITNNSNYVVTLAPTGSDSVYNNGAGGTQLLNPGASVILISDGSSNYNAF